MKEKLFSPHTWKNLLRQREPDISRHRETDRKQLVVVMLLKKKTHSITQNILCRRLMKHSSKCGSCMSFVNTIENEIGVFKNGLY